MRYKRVVLGGTFDRLHIGHIAHLKSAFESGMHVTIGLTSGPLIEHKVLSTLIEPYEVRKRALYNTIIHTWPDIPFEIVQITDIYGPTLSDPSFDALAVTPDTRQNGLKLNEARLRNGMSEMAIIEADLVRSADGVPISSTRIRLGQIDRQGKLYREIFKNSLEIPGSIRDKFRVPVGSTTGAGANYTRTAVRAAGIIRSHSPTLIITVGDIVTSSLKDAGIEPDIAFVDFKSDAKHLQGAQVPDRYDLNNPQGRISRDCIPYLEKLIKDAVEGSGNRIVTVEGEEDMLAIPCILLAPLNAVVIYGQKDHGIILNFVTEDLKKEVVTLALLLKPCDS